MKEALKGLFGSKKALAAIGGAAASAAVLLANKYGFGLDPEATATLVQAILGLAGVFILSQGAADIGKEKAKVESAVVELAMSAHRLENAELDDDDAEDAVEADEAPEPEVLTE
jgi:hypothetical protein